MSIHVEDSDGKLTCIKPDESLADLVVRSNEIKVAAGKPVSMCVKDIDLLGEDK
jgi:hypothetical protein